MSFVRARVSMKRLHRSTRFVEGLVKGHTKNRVAEFLAEITHGDAVPAFLDSDQLIDVFLDRDLIRSHTLRYTHLHCLMRQRTT